MENTDQNTPTNETPIAKKKWETPHLVFISSGDVQGGQRNAYREQSFHATPNGYSLKSNGTGFYQAYYNLFIS
jgi:hypothetical protein